MSADQPILLDTGFPDAFDMLAISSRIQAIADAAAHPAEPCPIPSVSGFEKTSHAVAASIRHLSGGGRLLHVYIQSDHEERSRDVVEWRLEDHPVIRETMLRTRARRDGRGVPTGYGEDPAKWNDADVLAGYTRLARDHVPSPRRRDVSPCPEIDAAIASIVSTMIEPWSDPDLAPMLSLAHPSPFLSPGSIRIVETRGYNGELIVRAPAWLKALPETMRVIVNDGVSNMGGATRSVSITFVEPQSRTIPIPYRPDTVSLLRCHSVLPPEGRVRIVSPWALDDDEEDTGDEDAHHEPDGHRP